MKHYKSVKILQNFQNIKSPCANLNPLFKTLATVLVFKPHIFSRDSSVAFDSYQSEKVRNAIPERNSYNHLDAFYVTCFARVCEIFTAVVSELQSGPHVVLSLYATTHTIVATSPVALR